MLMFIVRRAMNVTISQILLSAQVGPVQDRLAVAVVPAATTSDRPAPT